MPQECALCKADLQLDPWHALNCDALKRTDGTKRHDWVVRIFNVFLNQIGTSSRVEPRKLDGDGKRLPPDLEVHAGLRNRVLADVVISNPCCQTHEQQGASAMLKTAEFAANRKCTKYDPLAVKCDAKFVPLAFEVCSTASMCVSRSSSRKCDQADKEGYHWAPEDTVVNFRRRIVVAIQKGNASVVLRCMRVAGRA